MSEDATNPTPWERRDGESDQAWAAFVAFRNLGPNTRTLSLAAAEVGKSRSTLSEFSRKNDWRKRATAWDMHCDEQERGRDATEHANNRRLMLQEHAGLGRRLRKLTVEALLPDDDDEAKKQLADLPKAVVLKMMAMGVDLERQARAQLAGRGIDPRDAQRIADEILNIALTYVPEESHGAFLSDLEAMSGV